MCVFSIVELFVMILSCYDDDISQSFKFESLVMLLVFMATLLGAELADSDIGLETVFGVILTGLVR